MGLLPSVNYFRKSFVDFVLGLLWKSCDIDGILINGPYDKDFNDVRKFFNVVEKRIPSFIPKN